MNKITSNLMVTSVNETLKYYQDKLDFTFITGVDENKDSVSLDPDKYPLIWAMIQNDGATIMLQRKDSFTEELPEYIGQECGGTFTLYISMKDVESYYNKVKSKVDVVKDMYKTFYGAGEFVIRDLNGYVLYFGEM
ncbi:MAG: VOC family protein, partial [Acidaminobacteraceae bacterium]